MASPLIWPDAKDGQAVNQDSIHTQSIVTLKIF